MTRQESTPKICGELCPALGRLACGNAEARPAGAYACAAGPNNMPGKIFISYRREDSRGLALGICQYLAREFGPRNVFIDVDMHAGAKFVDVLESRLAECKVLLALIGPNWLNDLFHWSDYCFRKSSGSLAIFGAIRRTSSHRSPSSS